MSDLHPSPLDRQAPQQEPGPEHASDPDQVHAWGAWRDNAEAVDTTGTLDALRKAEPEDWLGSNRDPDVLLAVPNLGVDHIRLNVDKLRARVELRARVLDLVEISVGADASIDSVDLDIENVRAQAMLKVQLEKVVEIVDKALETVHAHPEILTNITAGLGAGLAGALDRSPVRDTPAPNGPTVPDTTAAAATLPAGDDAPAQPPAAPVAPAPPEEPAPAANATAAHPTAHRAFTRLPSRAADRLRRLRFRRAARSRRLATPAAAGPSATR